PAITEAAGNGGLLFFALVIPGRGRGGRKPSCPRLVAKTDGRDKPGHDAKAQVHGFRAGRFAASRND
ncbi:MAG TPA: hypothetical protein VH765_04030, partial [Xanthobacteraceae bacterium]